MKKLYCFIILQTVCTIGRTQNLVPNASFESFSACPVTFGELYRANSWINPAAGSPDYFNACATSTGVPANGYGYQAAHTGVAYAGIIVGRTDFNYENWREYIEAQLTSPLTAGTCYTIGMFVNLSDRCKYTSDKLEVYFSNSLVSGISINTNLWYYTPQVSFNIGFSIDTLNWTSVAGTYVAHGGERYIIIGNFQNSTATGMSYINPGGLYNWSYFQIDDICLTSCTSSCATGIAEHNSDDDVKINVNPFNETLTLTCRRSDAMEIALYDITSRKMLQQQFMHTVCLNTQQLAKGIYLYVLTNKEGVVKSGKIVKE